MSTDSGLPDDIVVGVDSSESARRALTWAADYARASGRRLRAVHVYSGKERQQDVVTSKIQRYFSDLQPETDWQLEFCVGPAGRVMTERSGAAQLLVLGTREHTGVDRILGGSVSHYCLSRVQCPLVIVPPPDTDDH